MEIVNGLGIWDVVGPVALVIGGVIGLGALLASLINWVLKSFESL